jgi:pre-mRNA-processing factor 39
VGLDFLAHPFWDKYIEYEERNEGHDNIFAILGRIIHLPLHQYARYFERYRTMAAQRPINQLAPAETVAGFSSDIARETGQKQKAPADLERDLRARVDAYHLEIFHRTQAETTKRWTYEQEIKRPYYHVTELDEPQLANWRKYLDFEEAEGDYLRTKFLYERCMVTAANYEEFWYRYARWTLGQVSRPIAVRNEEVRNIYQRASCTYIFQDEPEIRLYYARFEESLGKADTAIAIHEAILFNIPGHLETIISLVNTHRRQYGIDAAIEEINKHIMSQGYNPLTRGALVSELARLTWKTKGDVEEARKVFASNAQWFQDCKKFWVDWLLFERDQPTSENVESQRYERVKAVYNDVRQKSTVDSDIVKDLSAYYLEYLEQRGGKEAMVEYMQIDRDINGPASVANAVVKTEATTEVKKEKKTSQAKQNGNRGA